MLQEMLPNATVHQDLWHATQRVKRAVTVKCSKIVASDNGGNAKQWRKTFKTEFMKVFRAVDDKDVHKPRMKATPSSKEMLQNFDKFIATYVTGFEIPSAVLTELNNLRVHISKGCLSDQPPKCGTNKNENIHKHANAFFSRRGTLSVQVFEALMDTFIFERNKNIAKKKNLEFNSAPSSSTSVIQIKDTNEESHSTCSISSKADHSLCTDENIQDIPKNVKFLCEAREVIESFGIPKSTAQQVILACPFTKLLPHHNASLELLLNEKLRELNFEVSKTQELMTCLYNSSISWVNCGWADEKTFCDNVILELKKNWNYYFNCVPDNVSFSRKITEQHIDRAQDLVQLYHSGDDAFASFLRCMLIRVVSNIIGCTCLILTSNPLSHISSIVPRVVRTCKVMCFAYTLSDTECKFYLVKKITKQPCLCGWIVSSNRSTYCNLDSCACVRNGYSCDDTPVCKCNKRVCAFFESNFNEMSLSEDSDVSCKCGVNDPKGSLKQRCVPFSRCKCAKLKKSCSGCKCHGCHNRFGARDSSLKLKGGKVVTELSDRKKISVGVRTFSKKGDISKLSDMGVSIRDNVWFFSETVMLADLKRKNEVSSSKLCKLYNLLITQFGEIGRLKSESEVVSKLKHVRMY